MQRLGATALAAQSKLKVFKIIQLKIYNRATFQEEIQIQNST